MHVQSSERIDEGNLKSGWEKSMPVQCFEKRDSDRPVCSTHNVPLVPGLVPIDANAPWLGRIACSLCPVSRAVVDKKRMAHAPVHF
jgi:hypothetical protein